MRHTENGLLNALEKALRERGEAMDCNELFAIQEVKDHAPSVNRVSDYLGNLWRKGLVTRLPAPGESKSRARWMYMWKGRTSSARVAADTPVVGVEYTAKLLVDRPTVLISEEGSTIQIEMPNLTILIKTKPQGRMPQ